MTHFTIDVEHRALVTSTFQEGVNGYADTSDTYLTGDYPSSTYDDWTIAKIDLSGSGDHEHTLLRFDRLFGSGSGQIPFGSEITSATLTFYVSNSGDQFTVHRIATDWDNSATWNSFGSGIQANNVEALSTPDVTSAGYVSSGWTNLDVTTSLEAWAAAPESNFGWAMLPTDTNSVQFYTSDNVSDWVPRLSVEYLAPNGDQHSNTPDASATPLDLSSGSASVSGTLETGTDRDVFSFTLTESVVMTIDLGWTGAGSFVDSYLRLYDSAGTQIAYDDDGGSGTSSNNSRITVTLSPGTYFISAGSYADSDLGDFRLDMFTS